MNRRLTALAGAALLALTGCGGADADEDLATCLLGTWEGNPDEVGADFATQFADLGEVTDVASSGRTLATYEGDRVTWDYRDLRFEVTFAEPGLGVVVAMSGREDARYAVTDDEVLVDDARNLDATMQMLVEFDGETVDVMAGVDLDEVAAAMPSRLFTMTCAGDALAATLVESGGQPYPNGPVNTFERR